VSVIHKKVFHLTWDDREFLVLADDLRMAVQVWQDSMCRRDVLEYPEEDEQKFLNFWATASPDAAVVLADYEAVMWDGELGKEVTLEVDW
jgi:hypothetical protein